MKRRNNYSLEVTKCTTSSGDNIVDNYNRVSSQETDIVTMYIHCYVDFIIDLCPPGFFCACVCCPTQFYCVYYLYNNNYN